MGEEIIIRVDLTNGVIRYEKVPRELVSLGGRGLIADMSLREIDALCEPLGALNKLIIAPGLLGGYGIPCADRISVGGKSPLTGGIKESNAGGTTGGALARLGIKALILEGKAPKGKLYLLEISGAQAKLVERPDLRGLGNYSTAEKLRKEYGSKAALMTIGPAGEKGIRTACIANVDIDGRPSRVNGRGGLGAVMGSKGIKAIVVNAEGARHRKVMNSRFTTAIKEYVRVLKGSPITKGYRDYGTAGNLSICNALGCLPVCNFSKGSSELAEEISGEKMREVILSRGGVTSHRCMPGCLIECSNVFVDRNGKELVAPLEYETLGLLGSNCGVFDLDAVARLNYLCNDIGIDTIETGAALGIAMEAGLLAFGDWEGMYKIISGITAGEILSLVIGAGATVTGKVLNVERIPAVKGQGMAAYDPRALKGLGVTYATSPQGADHTAGLTLRMNIDHLSPEGQLEASCQAQVRSAFVDTLGLCNFASAGLGPRIDLLLEMLRYIVPGDWDENMLWNVGKRVLLNEIEFNTRAGIPQEANELPEFMRREALPPRGSCFDVDREKLKEFKKLLT